MLQLRKEPLGEVAVVIEGFAEARFQFAIAFWRDVERGALVLDQLADAVSVVGLVGQYDGPRAQMVEERIGDLAVMRLPGGPAEPDRELLRVNNDVDLRREPAA
jgi:hypothetical protein